MPFAPEAKLSCGFLSYILETEDLWEQMIEKTAQQMKH